MTQRVYCAQAIYLEEYVVDIPEDVPRCQWEEYVLDELRVKDRDPDDTSSIAKQSGGHRGPPPV